MTHLLDANALIALVIVDHEHHRRAASWSTGVDGVAVCPIVEGALVRYLVRAGESVATAMVLLAALHASPKCEFWPDSIPFTAARLQHVTGHRQVTDAYLASLAASRGSLLATFDRSLATVLPDHTILIA